MTESLVEKFYGIVDGYYSGTRDFNLIEEALKEYENRKHINKDVIRAAYMNGFDRAANMCDHSLGDMVDDGFEEWYNREVANPPEGWDKPS